MKFVERGLQIQFISIISRLKNCKNCFCIAFCPNCVEGAKKHCEENNSQRCAQLRIAAEDYRNEQTLGHQVQSYKPKSKNKFEKLPENIELFFSKDVSEMVSNKLPGYQDSELRYLTFLYTCPLTTLFGAECAGTFGPKNIALEDMTDMTIHLVGTRLAEMRNLTGWEIIAHRLPQLKNLTIVFIGDECPLDEFPKDFTYKVVILTDCMKYIYLFSIICCKSSYKPTKLLYLYRAKNYRQKEQI